MEEEKNFKLISLNSNFYAKCSPQHYKTLKMYKWRKLGEYAITDNYFGKKISMHKFIMTVLENNIIKEGYIIDHKDVDDINNKLNNCIDNLRIITYSQNSKNVRKRKNVSSIYHGVHFNKKSKKYRVMISLNGKRKHVGMYDTEFEAGMTYDAYIIQNKLIDECYPLNFKEKTEELKKYNIKFDKKEKTTKYHYVSKLKNKYITIITENYKTVFRFTSNDEIECAKKSDEYITKNGLSKPLNFPNDYPNYIPKKIQHHEIEVLLDEGICKIKLFNNKETIISIESYDKVKYLKLTYKKSGVMTEINNKKWYLHRYLMDESNPKILIDHEDNNPFNNRLNNLRRTDHKGNSQNTKKRKTENTTNYVNVIKYGTKFKTIINNSTFKYTKIWNTEEYAARDRDLQYLKRLPNSLYKIYFAEDWKIPGEIERWSKILY